MIVKLKWVASGPEHAKVTVFVGVDGDHLENCCYLVFRIEEAQQFRKSLRMGTGEPGSGGFQGILESWSTEALRELIGGDE